jgi:RNA recognition motif-containing protein
MNLFVANLSPETNADGLKTLFSEFGPVVSSKVIYDPTTGASRGFGFVEIEDKFQSYAAIDNLDCSFFEGNIISVKEAKQNNTKGGGGGGNRPFNRGGGGGNRPQRPGGNPRFANNAPRPGGFRSNNNYGNNSGGGYNRDNNSGGYNRDNNYNRDRGSNYNSGNSGYNSGNNYNSNNNNNKDDDKDFNRF